MKGASEVAAYKAVSSCRVGSFLFGIHPTNTWVHIHKFSRVSYKVISRSNYRHIFLLLHISHFYNDPLNDDFLCCPFLSLACLSNALFWLSVNPCVSNSRFASALLSYPCISLLRSPFLFSSALLCPLMSVWHYFC